MRKWNLIITILLFILGVLCYIFFDVKPITILEDSIANKFLCGFIARVGLSLMFGWLLYKYGGLKFITFTRQFPKFLLWALPCFMVAIINFPFSALITNKIEIVRLDLFGLYALYIISIALLEELIFRGVLLLVVSDYLRGKKYQNLWIALICSLVFSLFHLANLFEHMSIGDVLLQCLYTFLIGGMLIITMLKTKNIWLCILIHALFDFGGMLVGAIAIGDPWDTVFWILTFVGGALCAGHVVYTLIKLDKNYVSE